MEENLKKFIIDLKIKNFQDYTTSFNNMEKSDRTEPNYQSRLDDLISKSLDLTANILENKKLPDKYESSREFIFANGQQWVAQIVMEHNKPFVSQKGLKLLEKYYETIDKEMPTVFALTSIYK